LNGWTVCCFHGARGGGAERQAEWQLPARRQDEGNDRSLEAYKINALTFAWGPIGRLAEKASAAGIRNGHPTGQGRKFIIEPRFAGRKSLM